MQVRLAISRLAILLALLTSVSGWALEPQTLFSFQLGLGPVRGALIEGPHGNFYGTTAGGGPMASGTVFRVTPAGVLTATVDRRD
ncbi:MAG TPA: choice-of-anchor tandem repeat GloVer-containing protein [Verrucomicrobiae bacterium]|nr:choice-of-anchor tandem repeat GloVer-containing protein [Verrucomicrobiae bacterium]